MERPRVRLVAVDPGRRVTAWAAWGVTGQLLSTGLAGGLGYRASLGTQALDIALAMPFWGQTVVVEQMVQYPHEGRKDSRQRQDRVANDLLDLQAVGGLVAGFMRATEVIWVPAMEWKGQVPKGITERRARLTLSIPELRALEADLARVKRDLQHNLWDAVGIGLWYLRRTGGK